MLFGVTNTVFSFDATRTATKPQLFLKQALAKERASATDLKKKMENKGK
jgi:hypothetical protein